MHAMAGIWAIAEPLLVGAGVVALPVGVRALVDQLRLRRWMPLLRRAFVVLDPLLNEHLRSYGSSEVRFAMELVTSVLADGELSREEVRQVVAELERRYRPSLGAGKGSAGLPEGSLERRLLSETAALVDRGDFSAASLSQAAGRLARVLR